MTLPSGIGVFSVMAASFSLVLVALTTFSSVRFGPTSPTQLCERFTTSSLHHESLALFSAVKLRSSSPLASNHSEAVVLDLVHPQLAGGRTKGSCWKARPNEAGRKGTPRT